jgi:hypothetical protein
MLQSGGTRQIGLCFANSVKIHFHGHFSFTPYHQLAPKLEDCFVSHVPRTTSYRDRKEFCAWFFSNLCLSMDRALQFQNCSEICVVWWACNWPRGSKKVRLVAHNRAFRLGRQVGRRVSPHAWSCVSSETKLLDLCPVQSSSQASRTRWWRSRGGYLLIRSKINAVTNLIWSPCIWLC